MVSILILSCHLCCLQSNLTTVEFVCPLIQRMMFSSVSAMARAMKHYCRLLRWFHGGDDRLHQKTLIETSHVWYWPLFPLMYVNYEVCASFHRPSCNFSAWCCGENRATIVPMGITTMESWMVLEWEGKENQQKGVGMQWDEIIAWEWSDRKD